MKILVIAPHPDDETIGCGGSLCIHAEQGDQTQVVFLTSGELGLKQFPREKAWAIREAEAQCAGSILGLAGLTFLRCSDWTLSSEIMKAADLLKPILQTQKPDLVYLPHPQEDHPDHKACLPILSAAAQQGSAAFPELRMYEVWTPLERFDFVQNIDRYMDRKILALRAHRSQLHELDYVRAVTGLNQYRGALASKSNFAEVFHKLK